MAHRAKIKAVPHRNKNGTLSQHKKDYLVSCRSRGKVCFESAEPTRAAAEALIEGHRESAFISHRMQHPNDKHHIVKHSSRKIGPEEGTL